MKQVFLSTFFYSTFKMGRNFHKRACMQTQTDERKLQFKVTIYRSVYKKSIAFQIQINDNYK
jgi:hypothetical protein